MDWISRRHLLVDPDQLHSSIISTWNQIEAFIQFSPSALPPASVFETCKKSSVALSELTLHSDL